MAAGGARSEERTNEEVGYGHGRDGGGNGGQWPPVAAPPREEDIAEAGNESNGADMEHVAWVDDVCDGRGGESAGGEKGMRRKGNLVVIGIVFAAVDEDSRRCFGCTPPGRGS